MSDPHIFIVRLSAARYPSHGFSATVREIETEATTTVQTPEALAASMLSALGVAVPPAPPSPPAVIAAPAPVKVPRPRGGQTWFVIAAGVLLLGAALWSSTGVSTPLPGTLLPLALLVATGLVSGFLSGLLGIGGALVVVPAMYLLLPWLGVPAERVPHVAVGSSLLAMLPTSLAATLAQHRRGGIDTVWLSRLAPGMLVGAAIGALFAMQLRGPALSLLFAAQSYYYGWGLMRSVPPAPDGFRASVIGLCARAPGWLAGPLVAAFCACAGMGAGSLTAPYMMSKGVTLLRAAATSCALNLCIAVGGGLALGLSEGWASPSAAASSVSWQAAAIVGGSAVLCVRQGVALAHRLPVALFRRMLGGVTLLGAAVLTLRTVWVSV